MNRRKPFAMSSLQCNLASGQGGSRTHDTRIFRTPGESQKTPCFPEYSDDFTTFDRFCKLS